MLFSELLAMLLQAIWLTASRPCQSHKSSPDFFPVALTLSLSNFGVGRVYCVECVELLLPVA